MPRPRDITYMNWITGKLRFGKTGNWEVLIHGTKMQLKHKDGFLVSTAPSAKKRWRRLRKKIAGEDILPEWVTLPSTDKNMKINCLDVIIKQV